MPPNKKLIPLEDIKGLKTLLNEDKTMSEIAAYYSEKLGFRVGRMTISRRIQELNEGKKVRKMIKEEEDVNK